MSEWQCGIRTEYKAKRTYVIMLIDVLIGRWQQTGSNSFIRDAMPLPNLKSRRLRSVFRLWSWHPTTLNLSILLLCIHENRRRFESQNGSHIALFSTPLWSADYASQCELRANARLSALLYTNSRSWKWCSDAQPVLSVIATARHPALPTWWLGLIGTH